LGAIDASRHAFLTEIIIVDNPPSEILPSASMRHDLIRINAPRRLGFGAACNFGAKAAKGAELLFLNPDVIVAPETIEILHASLNVCANVGLVGGKLINPGGAVQPSCRRFPTLRNLLFSRGSIYGRIAGRPRGSYILPTYDEITAVDWLAGAMILMRRSVFVEIGGFDESFFIYLEDTDLCLRLAQTGYHSYFVPQASAFHHWGSSTGHYRFRRIVWHHRSAWRYFRKHRPIQTPAVILGTMLGANLILSLLVELFTFRQ
jgi:GT2 family glycosyltransferase